MNEFDWIIETPPKVYVGMRFTIPDNESFKKPFTITKIEGGEVHIFSKLPYVDFTCEVDEDFANQNVRKGVWVLI